MISLRAEGDGFSEMVYDIPVFREINLFFDWFGSLTPLWQIGVGIAMIAGVWLFLKTVALIFGTSDE